MSSTTRILPRERPRPLQDAGLVARSEAGARSNTLEFLIAATAGVCELSSKLGDEELDRLVRRSHGRLLDMLIQQRRQRAAR